MLFNSHVFLLLFLPLFFAGWHLLSTVNARLAWLTAASLLFYGWFEPALVLLLLASVVVNYALTVRMHASAHLRWRRGWLALALVFNLTLLGWFKYATMLCLPIGLAAEYSWMPDGFGAMVCSVVLPVGISFYTFQSVSYTIDVFRGRTEPARSLLEFAAYLTFFPQLVAGPIVRFDDVRGALNRVEAPVAPDEALDGWGLVVLGLARKLLVADALGRHLDPLWQRADELSSPEAWLAVFGFGLQLYNDFAAYTDIARGLGKVLGIPLPVNFDSPWRSTDVSEFWRRWHVSLSTWFRDYVYIPLGGGRRGDARVAVNLMVTMVLCGAWHGAHVLFFAWGFYHGLLLVVHRMWRRWSPVRLPVPLAWFLTLFAVMGGWVFFRARSLGTFADVAGALVLQSSASVNLQAMAPTFGWVVLALLAAVVGPNSNQLRVPRRRISVVLLLLLGWVVVLQLNRTEPFAYFQF